MQLNYRAKAGAHTLYETLVGEVRRKLDIAIKIDGRPIYEVAAVADLSPSTVSKLWYGETKHPRASTVFKLAVCLGIEIKVIRNTSVTALRAVR